MLAMFATSDKTFVVIHWPFTLRQAVMWVFIWQQFEWFVYNTES